MIIYTEHITPRLQYIISVLFHQQAIVTNDKNVFQQSGKIKINYSSQQIHETEIRIAPHTLLFENIIQPQQVICFAWNELKVFFETDGDIPFDIFAASFYLITRYEEWLPHEKDEYGRYAHTNSLAHREGFLHLPLVNLWLKKFEKEVRKKFRKASLPSAPFRFMPTYDVDIAFKYSGKGFLKNAASFFKTIFKLNLKENIQQLTVLAGKATDPFDVFEWLHSLHKRKNIQAIYFFLLAEENKLYDKNILPSKSVLQGLIKTIASNNPVAIHPSWQSNDVHDRLAEEISRLSFITGKNITISRQHYIRMSFPETYRQLIRHNITDDHSMGYGSINGFRASYTNAFAWYDLGEEKQTSLNIHPFCYMDANAFFEEKLSAHGAAEEMKHYYSISKSVHGECIFIHHNHFLTEENEWIDWRKMYENFLMMIPGQ